MWFAAGSDSTKPRSIFVPSFIYLIVHSVVCTARKGVMTKRIDVDPTPDGGNKKRFEVKKWNAVAFWSWDVEVELCAICRNHIMDVCIECQAKEAPVTNEDCSIVWGMCNHAFHFHCISRWLQTRKVCPLDNQEWEFKRMGR